jgi:hypothetical protein
LWWTALCTNELVPGPLQLAVLPPGTGKPAWSGAGLLKAATCSSKRAKMRRNSAPEMPVTVPNARAVSRGAWASMGVGCGTVPMALAPGRARRAHLHAGMGTRGRSGRHRGSHAGLAAALQ